VNPTMVEIEKKSPAAKGRSEGVKLPMNEKATAASASTRITVA